MEESRMNCVSIRSGRKQSYPTFQDAQGVAKHMKKLRGNEYEAYHCRVCGKWHVGFAGNGSNCKEGDTVKRIFKVKNIYGESATLIKKSGDTWNVNYRGVVEMGNRIQERIRKGFEYEAEVEFPRRGSPLIIGFMELSKDTGMSLKEQKQEYIELGGDY